MTPIGDGTFDPRDGTELRLELRTGGQFITLFIQTSSDMKHWTSERLVETNRPHVVLIHPSPSARRARFLMRTTGTPTTDATLRAVLVGDKQQDEGPEEGNN